MKNSPAIYILSGALKTAIRGSGLSQAELGAIVGWDQARVSHLLRGTRFSEQTRAAVLLLGAVLNVEPALCVRYVGRRKAS